MDVKPFLHKHHLLFDAYKNQEAFCDECNRKIDGWAFTCELCKFWLHQSCAERKIPPVISHSLHSKLFLRNADFNDFICDKCFTLSRGCKYSNEGQSFNLDVICALSINDQIVKEESERSKDMGKKIQHFCHHHSLTLFNYRKVRWHEYCCSWCEMPLAGMSYGCVQCSPFFLHEFCLNTIPIKILEHPFHSHPLYLSSSLLVRGTCAVCDGYTESDDFCYCCRICDFLVHIFCAKLKPTLRHECHNHDLIHITARLGPGCRKCEGKVTHGSSIYRCVQCRCNFHFECLIPFTVTHKYHIHSLIVTISFKEDGLGEYYCDICEEQRNPKHPVYCCKECTYIAHIECGFGNKVIDAKLQLESTSSWKHEETQQKDLDFSTHHEGLKIKHFDHEHLLIFKKVIENNEKPLCEACEEEVYHQAYVCERKGCRYYLHKKCAELSNELWHPFHSVDHPLLLMDNRPPDFRQHVVKTIKSSVHRRKIQISRQRNKFICDNCREVSSGFMYRCFQCNLKLDVKCIDSIASNIVKQGPKGIERPTNSHHLIHNHELLLLNCRPTSKRSFSCEACSLNISGTGYCCLECELYVHESCLRKLPKEIQIQSHPQHKLPLIPYYVRLLKFCLACKSGDPSFWYICLECGICIHFYCAGSLLQRPLGSKSHSHNLYLFSKNKPRLLKNHQSSKCEKCKKHLQNQSIYHCIECDVNFHLPCLEIFYRVKCRHHIHPLTLKGCFAEDDSEEYYCDVCEEKRDPENDIYYCEECDGQFISHIECAADEVEEVLQEYGPAPYSTP